jgi:hypothetical protein
MGLIRRVPRAQGDGGDSIIVALFNAAGFFCSHGILLVARKVSLYTSDPVEIYGEGERGKTQDSVFFSLATYLLLMAAAISGERWKISQ